MNQPTPGQIAYGAYTNAVGGIDHNGRPTLSWHAIGTRVQHGWEMAAQAATDDRLTAIQQLANALMDSLPGDGWHLAHAIEQIASGTKTPAEALAEVDE